MQFIKFIIVFYDQRSNFNLVIVQFCLRFYIVHHVYVYNSCKMFSDDNVIILRILSKYNDIIP